MPECNIFSLKLKVDLSQLYELSIANVILHDSVDHEESFDSFLSFI